MYLHMGIGEKGKWGPEISFLENLRQNEGNLQELKPAASCKIKDVHV